MTIRSLVQTLNDTQRNATTMLHAVTMWSLLKDIDAWCGKDYPNWQLLQATIKRFTQHLENPMEAKTLDYGSIGWAVNHLRHGHKMKREGWDGKTKWLIFAPAGSIQLAQKFGGGLNTTAAVFMKTAEDELVPWLCSQSDLLADDWVMAEPVQPGHTSMAEPAENPKPSEASPVA